MRYLMVTALMLATLSAASAQTFTPISGPNNPVPSPICDLINFGFCPQPAPPPPPLPDPNAYAAPAHALPPVVSSRHGRRTHRQYPSG